LQCGPKRVHTDRCSNVVCFNYEAPLPDEAGRCIWECVPPATERNQQASTVSARRTGRLYGAPLVAIASPNHRFWGFWRGRMMGGRCSTPPVDAFGVCFGIFFILGSSSTNPLFVGLRLRKPSSIALMRTATACVRRCRKARLPAQMARNRRFCRTSFDPQADLI